MARGIKGRTYPQTSRNPSKCNKGTKLLTLLYLNFYFFTECFCRLIKRWKVGVIYNYAQLPHII